MFTEIVFVRIGKRSKREDKMSEEPMKKQLNTAKKSACSILEKAGYKIERASNNIYCIVAMRDAEWRAIKVGIKAILPSAWFLNEIKKLERLPCPDPKTIKKEVWIREKGEQNFCLYFYENNVWVDENLNPVNIFKM